MSKICSSIPIRSVSVLLTEYKKAVHSISKDGNCFYRALALSEHKDESFHKSIRYFAMNHIQSNAEEYIPIFGDSSTFYRCLNANKRDGVWNTEIADIAPTIIPDILDVHLIIYDYIEGSDTIGVYTFGDPSMKTVELLRTNNNHYDLLINKEKTD